MRIARLELEGFKSFAKPTLFDFEANITGVVGPNGCGKSNVVDAIRWVLGEASRKALRAKEGSDVVFSGSANRKAARKAEVSITFDNSDGSLKIPAARVKLTRRLHTGGEAEYLINDEPAKLRDLKELLAGTGAGMSAYCIMEQGKMDALIQSNPQDRRRVFEEAAGVGVLRKQQEDAQAKLTIVEQNLVSLTQVLDEVRGQLRKIKTQAGRALRYTEIKERTRLVHIKLSLGEFHRFDKQREKLLETISAAGEREGGIQAELAKTKMDLEDAEAKLSQAETESRRISDAVHKLEMRISQEASKRENAINKIESLKQAVARVKDTAERVRGQVTSLKQRRASLSQRAETLRAEMAGVIKRVAELAQVERESGESAASAEAELKQTRSALLDAIGRANQGLNERMRLDADIRSSRRRLESLDARGAECEREWGDISTRFGAAEAARESEEARLASLKSELAKIDADLGPLTSRAQELRNSKHALELKRGGKAERKGLLEGMRAMRDGLDDNARALIEDSGRAESFGVLGVFADKLRIDLAFAAALERTLGDLGGAIVVDDREHAHDLFDWLAGRGSTNVAIIARDAFAAPDTAPKFPGGHGVIGPLLESVKVAPGFEALAAALVGDVLLVADRSVARRLIEKGAKGYRIVTPTGELFSLPGNFSLAFGEGRAGVITQQSEIDRLDRELTDLSAEVESAAADLGSTITLQESLNKRGGELRSAVYDASMEAAGKRAQLESLRREHTRLTDERNVLAAEQRMFKNQIEADVAKLGKLSDAIAEAEEQKTACEQRLAALASETETRREALSAAQRNLADARVQEATLKTELKQADESLKGIDEALTRYADEIARGAAESETHSKQIRELEHDAKASVEVQAELEREHKELNSRRLTDDGSLMLLKSGVAQARDSVTKLNQKLYEEREGVTQARMDENRLFMQMDAVRRRLADLYNADIDTLYREYDAARDGDDEATARAELAALEDQLRKLGNVNLEAMDELKDVEERNDFYSKQEEDLIKAKRTLAEAIARIERETKRMFVATFEAVRTNFQRLFRRLFGGGSADIILENPEEPLTSGVEIIAKPPGKEALPIGMRSGGERALISVAMMFAIYETNPAPFAIMDEVDAPLDEANVGRYCELVAEYARISQIIVITHHKKTMTACDMLYGVTMQEPGISTKVTVDLREKEPALAGA
ncbi:MAG: chromosome segregation protein SMC [Planctomycetes bacterium]|nr:chromosome segregation protein SMC [Planctomycetota bacterium]